MGDRPWQERYRGLLNRLRVRADGGDWDCRQAADRIESLHDTVERLHALVGEDADRVPLTAEIERLRAGVRDAFDEGYMEGYDHGQSAISEGLAIAPGDRRMKAAWTEYRAALEAE